MSERTGARPKFDSPRERYYGTKEHLDLGPLREPLNHTHQGEETIAAAAKILKQAQIDCAMWTKSFGDVTLMMRWIRNQEKRGRNIYFSPATLRPMEKKGSKADVTSLRYLWVDIDPDGDVDPMDAAALDPVREAVLGLLTALPVGVPPPTWIIDSGRGIWAIWELARPFAKPDDAADGNTAWLEPHESVGAGIIEAIIGLVSTPLGRGRFISVHLIQHPLFGHIRLRINSIAHARSIDARTVLLPTFRSPLSRLFLVAILLRNESSQATCR